MRSTVPISRESIGSNGMPTAPAGDASASAPTSEGPPPMNAGANAPESVPAPPSPLPSHRAADGAVSRSPPAAARPPESAPPAPDPAPPGKPPRVATPASVRAVGTPVADNRRPDDLLHPSRMSERFGVWVRLFAWFFFRHVDFPARLGQAITACSREGVPVYVMGQSSLLDTIYLNDALLRRKMPRAEFSNGPKMTPFQPWRLAARLWWRSVRGVPQAPPLELFSALVSRRRSALVFLRRQFTFTPQPDRIRSEDMLRTLCQVQRELEVPIYLLPAVLVWERKGRDNNIIDAFFGDPLAPGPLRKLFGFVMNYRKAFVRAGEPVNLRAWLAEHGGAEDEELSARLKALLQQRLEVEHRVISGALVRPPAIVANELLSEPGFGATLEKLAVDLKRSDDSVRAEARANLLEIAADLRMRMVDLFSIVLTVVWARIYEGLEVDHEGLDAIREAGRRGPVVIAPSHKSHIDYLVISYIFYRNGMVPPHIAAGANLSFWPLGFFFRRAGAFFLRRSFKGQPIYGAAFRAYVRKLLADGHWLEFFIEGTRSRTGKLLPPRYGLLRIVVDAVASGEVEDVTVVPTNFGYERLIEEASYRRELEGGEKKAESAGDLLKATQVLAHKYGRMRVQFSEPMSLRRLLEAQGVQPGAADAAAVERAVKTIGYHIEAGINRAAVLTPMALVSSVLLSKVNRGIGKPDLQLRVGYLLDSAVRRGAVLSGPLRSALAANRQRLQAASTRDQAGRVLGVAVDPTSAQSARARTLGEAVAELIDGALSMIQEANWIFRKNFEDGDVFVVKREGRLHLDYYKNNLLHLFVPEALLATALLGNLSPDGKADADAVREDTKLLSRILKLEFVYEPELGFATQYQQTFDHFHEAGWLQTLEGGKLQVADTARVALTMYGKLVQNFIESYWIVGRSLVELGSEAVSESDFVARCQRLADRLYELGEVQCYEAVSKVNLLNALQIYLELGSVRQELQQVGKRSVRTLRIGRADETSAPLAPTVHRLETFASVWRSGTDQRA